MLNGFSFRYVTPWLWTPFTDIFSDWFSNADSRCGRFELACMECMEYYGFKNGKVICKDYYEDFVECKYKQLEVRVRSHGPKKIRFSVTKPLYSFNSSLPQKAITT